MGIKASSLGAQESRRGHSRERREQGLRTALAEVPGAWQSLGVRGLTLGVGGFGPGGWGLAPEGAGRKGQKETVGWIGEQQRCREKEGETRGRGETQG